MFYISKCPNKMKLLSCIPKSLSIMKLTFGIGRLISQVHLQNQSLIPHSMQKRSTPNSLNQSERVTIVWGPLGTHLDTAQCKLNRYLLPALFNFLCYVWYFPRMRQRCLVANDCQMFKQLTAETWKLPEALFLYTVSSGKTHHKENELDKKNGRRSGN